MDKIFLKTFVEINTFAKLKKILYVRYQTDRRFQFQLNFKIRSQIRISYDKLIAEKMLFEIYLIVFLNDTKHSRYI